MKIKRFASLGLALALVASLLCVPANAASFALRTGPGMLGSERVYTETVTADATGENRITVSVKNYVGDGSGNVYGTCLSHTTKTPVTFTRIGTKTIVVTGGVVQGTPMSIEMSLKNVVASETLRASGTVG